MAALGPAGSPGSLRTRTFHLIFSAEDTTGKVFDVALIAAILASVLAVMLESVQALRASYGTAFVTAEWIFTILFTIEYLTRIWCVDKPSRYIFSFFGIIDLVAVIPTYLSLLLPGGQVLVVLRILRVMRVFRVLKLARYMGAVNILATALRASRFKISVFLLAVLTIVVVVGSMMYLIEGADAGFTSIPRGVYWAVVTLTTVGYGDIAPVTPIGQMLAALVMVMGFAIIAVPTGIVTAEITATRLPTGDPQHTCTACGLMERDPAAQFCRRCATPFAEAETPWEDVQPTV